MNPVNRGIAGSANNTTGCNNGELLQVYTGLKGGFWLRLLCTGMKFGIDPVDHCLRYDDGT